MDYSYDYTYTATELGEGAAVVVGTLLVFSFFFFVIGLVMLISMWKIFRKAGKQGWEAIIPIYNMVILLDIVKLPMWYVIMFFIPVINFVFMIITYVNLAKAFGKDTVFAILLLFIPIIGFPMLAFGKSKYVYDSNTPVNENPFGQSNNNQMQQPVNNEPVQPSNEPNNQTQERMNNEESVNNDQNMKMCPQCNNKVSNDSVNCFICGYKF